MDLSALELEQPERKNKNNSKSVCVDNTNTAFVCDTEFDEHTGITNEPCDINSSDFECTDESQDECSNNLDDQHNTDIDKLKNNDFNNEISDFTATIQNEHHSNDKNKHTDIDTKHKENINNSQKPVDKCLQDKESFAWNHEEEPIFDFLGKANEIVRY